MPARTPRHTWSTYRASIGDRSTLFAAVRSRWGVARALYAGSYLDLSPSTVIPSVTYVDVDRRAAAFFADTGAVAADLREHGTDPSTMDVRFVHADYTEDLPVEDGSMDLLVSLFAGPVWDHCARYLAPGGLLLSNTSHGDASIAALDPRLQLVGVVQHRGDTYQVSEQDLHDHLVPTHPERADADRIRREGRGISYTRRAFAYLFEGTDCHRG